MLMHTPSASESTQQIKSPRNSWMIFPTSTNSKENSWPFPRFPDFDFVDLPHQMPSSGISAARSFRCSSQCILRPAERWVFTAPYSSMMLAILAVFMSLVGDFLSEISWLMTVRVEEFESIAPWFSVLQRSESV